MIDDDDDDDDTKRHWKSGDVLMTVCPLPLMTPPLGPLNKKSIKKDWNVIMETTLPAPKIILDRTRIFQPENKNISDQHHSIESDKTVPFDYIFQK